MALQRGISKKTGTIGNETHYKMEDKYFVRKKSSLTAKRVRTDPKFANSRNASGQFGRASTASRLLRKALDHLLPDTSQRDLHNRLIKVIREMIAEAEKSTKKKFPLNHLPWNRLLKFNLNEKAPFEPVLSCKYSINTNKQSGKITVVIPSLEPAIDVNVPKEATHFRIMAAAASINFNKEVFTSDYTATGYLSLTSENITDTCLSITLPTPVIHPLFVVIGSNGFIGENGNMSELHNQRFQPLAIVHIEYDPLPQKTARSKKKNNKNKATKNKQS